MFASLTEKRLNKSAFAQSDIMENSTMYLIVKNDNNINNYNDNNNNTIDIDIVVLC